MGEDVQSHHSLEKEDVLGVEVAQCRAQTHGGDTVNQHIQHCAKLAALTQQPCSVPVHSVQKTYIVIGSMN